MLFGTTLDLTSPVLRVVVPAVVLCFASDSTLTRNPDRRGGACCAGLGAIWYFSPPQGPARMIHGGLAKGSLPNMSLRLGNYSLFFVAFASLVSKHVSGLHF